MNRVARTQALGTILTALAGILESWTLFGLWVSNSWYQDAWVSGAFDIAAVATVLLTLGAGVMLTVIWSDLTWTGTNEASP